MQRKMEFSLPSEVIEVLKGHYSCPYTSSFFFIQPRILNTNAVSAFLILGLPSGHANWTDWTRWAPAANNLTGNKWLARAFKVTSFILNDFLPPYLFWSFLVSSVLWVSLCSLMQGTRALYSFHQSSRGSSLFLNGSPTTQHTLCVCGSCLHSLYKLSVVGHPWDLTSQYNGLHTSVPPHTQVLLPTLKSSSLNGVL